MQATWLFVRSRWVWWKRNLQLLGGGVFHREAEGGCRLPGLWGQDVAPVLVAHLCTGSGVSESVGRCPCVRQNFPMSTLPEGQWSRHSLHWRRDCFPGTGWQASMKKSSQASGQGEWWSEVLHARRGTQHLGAAGATGRIKWPECWLLLHDISFTWFGL